MVIYASVPKKTLTYGERDGLFCEPMRCFTVNHGTTSNILRRFRSKTPKSPAFCLRIFSPQELSSWSRQIEPTLYVTTVVISTCVLTGVVYCWKWSRSKWLEKYNRAAESLGCWELFLQSVRAWNFRDGIFDFTIIDISQLISCRRNSQRINQWKREIHPCWQSFEIQCFTQYSNRTWKIIRHGLFLEHGFNVRDLEYAACRNANSCINGKVKSRARLKINGSLLELWLTTRFQPLDDL